MLALASRMLDGDRDRAADVVQDTIAHLWQKRASLEASMAPESLCMTAVRNRCISLIRAERPFGTLEEASVQMTRTDSSMDCEYLYRAIERLDENRRRVVVMSMRGFNCEEIAAELALSPANVRQLLSRGRRQLKEILSQL